MEINDLVKIKKCGTVCKVVQLTRNLQFAMIDLSDKKGIKFRWVHINNLEAVR